MTQKFKDASRSSALLVLICAAVGCTGSVAESDGNDGDTDSQSGGGGRDNGSGDGSGNMPGLAPGETLARESAGPKPLRRLTRDEYDHTLRDLLGDDSHPARAFAQDVRGEGGFYSPLSVSAVETSAYREAAEKVAAQAVTKLESLAPCKAGTAEATCIDDFIAKFGARAFRRPLTAPERQSLQTLYKAVKADPLKAPYKEAVQIVTAAILQSPQFLYHWQATDDARERDGDLVKLDGYEVASRLSYFLWSSMPDDELFAAAAAGELADEAGVTKHATRMLKDPRAQDAVGSFFAQLLDLERLATVEKDKGAYPSFDRALAQAMSDEVQAFVRHAVLEEGNLAALYKSPVSFVNERLAQLYGHRGVTGASLQKVELNPAQRFGVLTKAGFLATHANTYETSPILRGKLIFTRLFCQSVPPPPPDIDAVLPPPQKDQQTRERFEELQKDPVCASCHKLMHGTGFPLESYDGIGAFRTMDAGRPVKTDGVLVLPEADVEFADARAMADLLVENPESRRCMTRQWLRFGLGRADDEADLGSLQRAASAFSEGDGDFQRLMLSVVKSKSFRFRSLLEGEVL